MIAIYGAVSLQWSNNFALNIIKMQKKDAWMKIGVVDSQLKNQKAIYNTDGNYLYYSGSEGGVWGDNGGWYLEQGNGFK